MATPEDIIEARRIANARAMAPKTATPAPTPKAQPRRDSQVDVGRTDSAATVDERTQMQAKTLTPDQLAARQAQAEAATAVTQAKANAADIAATLGAKVNPVTGKIDTTTIPKTTGGKKVVGYVQWRNPINGVTYNVPRYDDGTDAIPEWGGGAQVPQSFMMVSGNQYSGGNVNTGSTTTTATATTPSGPTLAKDVFKQTLALYFGEAELAKGWMDELYNNVSKFYRNGTDVATSFNMALLDARNNPNLKSFTDRFKGIYALQDLRQAGKPVSVPTIAEYVSAQKGMADIFNEAGLGDISTEQFTGELIGKGNSVSTVADKIAKVFERIDMAPKEIKDTLSRYFPTVDKTKLAKTILLGEKGVTQLVDELNKYNVLAAAEQQGVAATGAKGILGGVTEERAGEYARAGETYGSLLPKFAEVRKSTPVVSKLAGISKAQDIGQLGVEQALISGLAQPMETIQQLGEEEIGRFSGKAGRAELGLASQRRANRAF